MEATPDDPVPVRSAVTVDIWSDVVCPWCYIGKRRFETGLASVAEELDADVVVTYRAYQLDPTASPGAAEPVRNAYAKKFGGAERAEEILAHVTATAAADGIEFDMDRALRANTLLAHRLIHWAARPDSPVSQADLKERVMRAYFTDGDNIGDPDVLTTCAVDLGADRDEVESYLASTAGLAEVTAELDAAGEHGITAVPTYVFNGRWAVPGAQDPATFARVLAKMARQASEPTS